MGIFDEYVERRHTDSLKWDYCGQRFGKADILPMWVADMDFKSPAPLVDAVAARAKQGVFGYTEPPERLTDLIISWMMRRQEWEISPEDILYTPGVVSSVDTAIQAFTEPGDRVLMQTPIYYPFYSSIGANGRELVTNPLKRTEETYHIDFDDLEEKLAGGVRLMIFCSPHNPIGRVWSREDIGKVLDLCRKHRVLLVSDEIHSDLVFSGLTHIPVLSLEKDISRFCITLISPTKTFNMAGLSLSAAVIPDGDLRGKFLRTMRRNGADMLNLFGLTAAEAAYRSCESWLEELLPYLEGNRDYMMNFLAENIPAIKPYKPEATYLTWLDCSGLNTERNRKDFFVEFGDLGLNDGGTFGEEGRNFVRLNFACPRSLLTEGLERMKKAADSLLGKS